MPYITNEVRVDLQNFVVRGSGLKEFVHIGQIISAAGVLIVTLATTRCKSVINFSELPHLILGVHRLNRSSSIKVCGPYKLDLFILSFSYIRGLFLYCPFLLNLFIFDIGFHSFGALVLAQKEIPDLIRRSRK
jgi:hypothetical protein